MPRMSMKSRQKWCALFRLSALVILTVLVVPPLRNLVLSPFLPGAWLAHNSFRLAQMLMDNQHFPIQSPFWTPEPGYAASLTVNLSDVDKFIYKEDPFQEFFMQTQLLKALALTDNKAARELARVEGFQPVMSLKERAQLMFTMHVFQKACEKHSIHFFIFEGALLGAYRHHGLVPWDDDIDIALNASDWQKVRRVLSNIPGFTLFAPSDSQWKFYLSDLPAFSDKPFKFPYLDLFFFHEQGPYVWGITWGVKNHLMLLSKHLYPLTTVRWEMLTLPAPACVKRMVEENYGVSECMTPQYVHKTNERHSSFTTGNMNCRVLHKYLPFVFRQRRNGMVLESRRVGNREFQNATVPLPPDVCFQD